MGTELSLPSGFGPVADVFKNGNIKNDELGAGIQASYAVLGFKGKVWSVKFQGEETKLMRDDGDGPRNSIEVVIVDSATAISKIFYQGGYVEGSNAAPDCWSSNGVTPDASVKTKCNKTCADCPMNAWGSRVSESGKNGKQCADSRRMAISPVNDLDNEAHGGPMLLRVPAASLKDLMAFGKLLTGYNYPYYAVATRISFSPDEAYPKFVFGAIRPLTQEEALKVIELRTDTRTANVLNEKLDAVAGTVADRLPESPFEEEKPVPLSEQAKAPTPTGKPAAKPAVKTAPKVEVKPEPKPEPKGPTPEEVAAKAKADRIAAARKAAAAAAAKAAEELAALEAEESDAGSEGVETSESASGSTAQDSFDELLNNILGD